MLTAVGLRAQYRAAIQPDFSWATDLLPISQMAMLEMQQGEDDYISENQSI